MLVIWRTPRRLKRIVDAHLGSTTCLTEVFVTSSGFKKYMVFLPQTESEKRSLLQSWLLDRYKWAVEVR